MYSFGYNSFWNFGSVAVQELLTKSDLQLDELLEEEGLILEVKSQNQNLYEFLLKEENFKELISCAITIPDAELHQNNQKKLYKYPFTCADILSSDSQPIVSEFFKSKKEIQESTRKSEVITDDDEDDDEVNVDSEKLEKTQTSTEDKTKEEEDKDTASANEFPYLDYLFAFLESESLNLTSAGYFAKIVNNLLNKRPAELISYIYERKPELLHKMIKHIYSKSIAEFLAKLLTFETSVLANANNEVYNERRSEVLKEIIKKLQPEFDLEEINNTAYLICEVFSKYNSMHNSHEILNNLLEKSVIDYFFQTLKTGKPTSACAVALILGNIFAYYILINTPKAQESNLDDPFGESQSPSNIAQQVFELTEEIPLLKAFVENLEQIIKFIGNSSEQTIPGQHGAQAVPFGSARLKVLELIIIAMKANNDNIYNKLIEFNFFETLKNILIRHDWNNLLHNQVEKIFTHIIESGTDDLKIALFEKAKILDFIVDNSKDSEFTLSGKHARKVRKGYLGHLVRLSNKIVENRDPILQKYIEGNTKWKEYVESLLAETNQRDRTNFGGKDPRAPSPEPSYIHERDQYRDEDEKREEDDEDEMEIEEVENMGEEEKDHHPPAISTSDEFIQETEHHVLQATSPKNEEEERIKQASVPVRGRNSFDPLNRFIPDYDEEIKEENENIWVLEPADLKTVEETLDAKFYPNHYWKKTELYSAEDILKELEGL